MLKHRGSCVVRVSCEVIWPAWTRWLPWSLEPSLTSVQVKYAQSPAVTTVCACSVLTVDDALLAALVEFRPRLFNPP